MQQFNEWLKEKHPDFVLNEDWRDWLKKGVVGATLAGASLGLTGCSGGKCDVSKPGSSAEADTNYQQLYQQEYNRQLKIWKNPGKANEVAHQKTQMKMKKMKLQERPPVRVNISPGHYDADWEGSFEQGELK